jgi:hypothetical protein
MDPRDLEGPIVMRCSGEDARRAIEGGGRDRRVESRRTAARRGPRDPRAAGGHRRSRRSRGSPARYGVRRGSDVVKALPGRAPCSWAGPHGLRRRPPGGRVDEIFAQVNLFLAVFNLLPIPPLDGSALLERVLPREWLPERVGTSA